MDGRLNFRLDHRARSQVCPPRWESLRQPQRDRAICASLRARDKPPVLLPIQRQAQTSPTCQMAGLLMNPHPTTRENQAPKLQSDPKQEPRDNKRRRQRFIVQPIVQFARSAKETRGWSPPAARPSQSVPTAFTRGRRLLGLRQLWRPGPRIHRLHVHLAVLSTVLTISRSNPCVGARTRRPGSARPWNGSADGSVNDGRLLLRFTIRSA
jgi:hypothetical protein